MGWNIRMGDQGDLVPPDIAQDFCRYQSSTLLFYCSTVTMARYRSILLSMTNLKKCAVHIIRQGAVYLQEMASYIIPDEAFEPLNT